MYMPGKFKYSQAVLVLQTTVYRTRMLQGWRTERVHARKKKNPERIKGLMIKEKEECISLTVSRTAKKYICWKRDLAEKYIVVLAYFGA